jgi:hypothetical protein
VAKKAKCKLVTVYGWEGSGASAAEAKANAIKDIEEASKGSYDPVIVKYKDMVGLGWREKIGGWWYKIIRPDTIPDGKDAGYSCCGSYESKEEVKRAIIRHVCQNGYNPGSDPEAPEFMTNEEDRREHKRWASWQTGYRLHKNKYPEASDDECRAAADVYAYGYTLQPVAKKE